MYKKVNSSYILENPVQSTLAINRNTASKVTLTIYNNIGQQVMQTVTNDLQILVHINKLTKGIYNCTLITNEGIEHLKFVKQ